MLQELYRSGGYRRGKAEGEKMLRFVWDIRWGETGNLYSVQNRLEWWQGDQKCVGVASATSYRLRVWAIRTAVERRRERQRELQQEAEEVE